MSAENDATERNFAGRDSEEETRPDPRGNLDRTEVDASRSVPWFPAPGDDFASFRLESELGVGGMGVVYRALDTTLDRICAIKVLRPESLDEHGRTRFLHEARACSRISHPNVVVIYSCGVERDVPYFAMEYVEGTTLRERLLRQKPSWSEAVAWMCQILGGLSRYHEHGVVHRDLKPSNIMITPDGDAKLMDFGVAHVAGTPMTETGQVVGTVPYMSPEQVHGTRVTPRSDVFCAGVVLYELLTGEHPFAKSDAMSTMFAITTEDTPPLRSRGEVPAPIREAVRRALSKDPDERFADAGALSRALEDGGDGGSSGRAVSPRRAWTVLPMVVILAGTLLWTLRPSDEPSPIRDRALAIVERGVALEARGDDEGAREAYQEAIEVDPALPSPWNNLALLAAERGDPLAADSLLSRALVLDPAYAAAWWNRGDVAWDLGQLDLAEEHYRRALAADPELHEASVNLGSLLIERDRYEDALALSASTLQRSPVAPIDDYLRRNVARALDALGRTDEAREVWRELLESEVPELQALARGALESDRSE